MCTEMGISSNLKNKVFRDLSLPHFSLPFFVLFKFLAHPHPVFFHFPWSSLHTTIPHSCTHQVLKIKGRSCKAPGPKLDSCFPWKTKEIGRMKSEGQSLQAPHSLDKNKLIINTFSLPASLSLFFSLSLSYNTGTSVQVFWLFVPVPSVGQKPQNYKIIKL